jgi:phosphoribosylamine--glycine ligase
MSIVVIGGGGREHALAWALSQSGSPVVVTPGNGGTSWPGVTCAPYAGVAGAVALCKGAKVVVVGPEAPLEEGIADLLRIAGVPCFGPTALAARLETSKAWSKEFMIRHNIPTASHRTFASAPAAEAYIRACPHKVVVKASGLCAGKGVVVAATADEAVEAARSMLGGSFGDAAGAEAPPLEACLAGWAAFCDAVYKPVIPLPLSPKAYPNLYHDQKICALTGRCWLPECPEREKAGGGGGGRPA